MTCGFSIKIIIALVNALAKLHNSCINEGDGTPDSILAIDQEHLMHNEGGSIKMVSNDTHNVTKTLGHHRLWPSFSRCATCTSESVEQK
jgi:hypothetical protein